mgnify:CR=1 FL=1
MLFRSTVASTDTRNWELLPHPGPERRFSQSRAVALDMESATIAANGFRFRVPYGTLLCVSDKPLHGEIKLPGMANHFYRERVDQHLRIGIRAVERLRGVISQRPSAVSAIKVDGVRAYARVRAGEQVVLPERSVVVSRFDVGDIRRDAQAGFIDIDATFTVSSGTYIRALARDLGEFLGIGGHLVLLRRTRSGRFDIGSAVALPEPGEAVAVLDLAQALRKTLPCVGVDVAAAMHISHGRSVPMPGVDAVEPSTDVGVLSNGDVVAIARLSDGLLHPKAVFASPAS